MRNVDLIPEYDMVEILGQESVKIEKTFMHADALIRGYGQKYGEG